MVNQLLKPLDQNVLLTKVNDNKSSSLLYMPSKDNSLYEVINIGKEVIELKVGNKVYLDETKLKKFTINNEEYYIVCEKDIYILVEE